MTLAQAAVELGLDSIEAVKEMEKRSELVFELRRISGDGTPEVNMVPTLIIDDLKKDWDEVLHSTDAAEILGWKCSATVAALAVAGELEGEHVGSSWFFEKKVVEAFREARGFRSKKVKAPKRAKAPIQQLELSLTSDGLLNQVHTLFLHDKEFKALCEQAYSTTTTVEGFMEKVFNKKVIYGDEGVCWFIHDANAGPEALVEVHLNSKPGAEPEVFPLSRVAATVIVDRFTKK
jgi:hypothetical protein